MCDLQAEQMSPLCFRTTAIMWTNARWLVRMKTSETETPRPGGKTELKQVRLQYLCLVVNTEIMGCMWKITCKAIVPFKVKCKWKLANKRFVFSSWKKVLELVHVPIRSIIGMYFDQRKKIEGQNNWRYVSKVWIRETENTDWSWYSNLTSFLIRSQGRVSSD